jgi:large subunit ribosomal protein L25
MKTIELQAAVRDTRGKGPARASRRAGNIPAILYGEAKDPVALTLDSRTIEKILASGGGGHSILALSITGPEPRVETAMVKDVQRRTITSKPIHVDLLRISMDKVVEVAVAVHLINTEEVKKAGGIIQQIMNEITIESLPGNIPEFIAIDLAAVNVGDSIHVRDVIAPEGITIIEDEDEVVATVLTPVVETKTEAVVGEGAEGEAAVEGKEEADKEGDKKGDKKTEKKPEKKQDKK